MTEDEKKLFEKIVRAKVALEGTMTSHTSTCPAEYDGNCTCGSSRTNAKINQALRELD